MPIAICMWYLISLHHEYSPSDTGARRIPLGDDGDEVEEEGGDFYSGGHSSLVSCSRKDYDPSDTSLLWNDPSSTFQ